MTLDELRTTLKELSSETAVLLATSVHHETHNAILASATAYLTTVVRATYGFEQRRLIARIITDALLQPGAPADGRDLAWLPPEGRA